MSNGLTSDFEIVSTAKQAVSRFVDHLEVISNQDVDNGSAPISRGGSTNIWTLQNGHIQAPGVTLHPVRDLVIEGRTITLNELETSRIKYIDLTAPELSDLLLRDSRRAFHEFKLRESVLIAAVAVELEMVRDLLNLLSRGIDIGLTEYALRKKLGLSSIFSCWATHSNVARNLDPRLNSDLRNDIAHRGKRPSVQEAFDFYQESSFIQERILASYLG